MSGSRFRRSAMPYARTRWTQVLMVLLVASAAFALSCVSAPPGAAADEPPLVHTVSAPAQHVDRDPCEEHPGGHDCHSSDPRAVLGHTPPLGIERAAAPWRPATASAAVPRHLSRDPERARPPDLHELQLLRV